MLHALLDALTAYRQTGGRARWGRTRQKCEAGAGRKAVRPLQAAGSLRQPAAGRRGAVKHSRAEVVAAGQARHRGLHHVEAAGGGVKRDGRPTLHDALQGRRRRRERRGTTPRSPHPAHHMGQLSDFARFSKCCAGPAISPGCRASAPGSLNAGRASFADCRLMAAASRPDARRRGGRSTRHAAGAALEVHASACSGAAVRAQPLSPRACRTPHRKHSCSCSRRIIYSAEALTS